MGEGGTITILEGGGPMDVVPISEVRSRRLREGGQLLSVDGHGEREVPVGLDARPGEGDRWRQDIRPVHGPVPLQGESQPGDGTRHGHGTVAEDVGVTHDFPPREEAGAHAAI